MISPPTIGEMIIKLGLPIEADSILRQWWTEIAEWEREQCAMIAESESLSAPVRPNRTIASEIRGRK